MSIRVNSGSMLLGRTSGFDPFNSAYTVSFLAKQVTDLNDYGHLFAGTSDNDEISNNYQNADFIGIQADGTTAYGMSYVGGTGVGNNSTVSNTIGTIYRWTLVRESSTTLKLYRNGTLVETITQNVSGRAAQGGQWFGRLHGGFPSDIEIEGVICWNVGLTAGEVSTQAGYLNPAVQLGAVTTYTPMTAGTVGAAVVSTTGTNWTVFYGTPTIGSSFGYPIFTPGISADLSKTLDAITVVSDATVQQQSPGPVIGDVNVTLDSITTTSASSLSINGNLNVTLDNITASGAFYANWSALVTWDDIVGGQEDYFLVKVGTSSNSYTLSYQVPQNTTSFYIPNLSSYTTYYSRVVGVVGGVEQTPSQEIVIYISTPFSPLAADSLSLSVLGNAASLYKNSNLVLIGNVATYTLSGQQANLFVDSFKTIFANVGNLSLAGISSNLYYSKMLQASPYSASLVGNDVNMLVNKFLTAAASSYTIAAINAQTLKKFNLGSSAYSASFSGVNAQTLKHKILVGGGSSYSLTMYDAFKLENYVVIANQSNFNLSGIDANLVTFSTKLLTGDVVSFSLAGIDVGTYKGSINISTKQDYSMSSGVSNLLKGFVVIGSSASFTIVGLQTTQSNTKILSANVGNIVLNGEQAALNKFPNFTLLGDTGGLSIVGLNVLLETNKQIDAVTKTLSMTTFNANLNKNVIQLPPKKNRHGTDNTEKCTFGTDIKIRHKHYK